jgi:hypothetical protein
MYLKVREKEKLMVVITWYMLCIAIAYQFKLDQGKKASKNISIKLDSQSTAMTYEALEL